MKHTQKMILIPHEKYERLKHHNNNQTEIVNPSENKNSNTTENQTSETLNELVEKPTLNINQEQEDSKEKDTTITQNSSEAKNDKPQIIINDQVKQKDFEKKRKIPLPGIPNKKVKKQRSNTWQDNWKIY